MNKRIVIEEQGERAYSYLSQFVDLNSDGVEVVKTTKKFNIRKITDLKSAIVNLNKINDINKMNDFFKAVNEKLAINGVFIGCVETKVERKIRIFKYFIDEYF